MVGSIGILRNIAERLLYCNWEVPAWDMWIVLPLPTQILPWPVYGAAVVTFIEECVRGWETSRSGNQATFAPATSNEVLDELWTLSALMLTSLWRKLDSDQHKCDWVAWEVFR